MRKGDRSDKELPIIIFAIVIILVILAGFLVLKITGKMIYGATTDISACGVLSSPGDSYTLTADVSALNTCFEVTAPFVTLDCDGHEARFDASGLGNAAGIYASSVDGITLKNCAIVDETPSLGDRSIGINLVTVTNSDILNNDITYGGTADSWGMAVHAGSNSNSFENNEISELGAGLNNHAVYVDSANINEFSGGTISTLSPGSYGMRIQGSVDTTIDGVTFNDPASWLFSFGLVTHTNGIIFQTPDGKITFLSPTADIIDYDIKKTSGTDGIDIDPNIAHFSDSFSDLNTGAVRITLEGLSFTSVKAYSDADFNGIYDSCNAATIPSCNNLIYAGGTATVDVSGPANYMFDEACGDGVLDGSEGCDDDNLIGGDGCSATCTVELGYNCVGEPSVCTIIPPSGGGSSGGGGSSLALKILGALPIDGFTGAPVENLQIKAEFNKRIKTESVNSETMTLRGPEGLVPLDIKYDYATNTATASVLATLQKNVVYTATVSGDVKDSAGKSMGEPYIWQFVTEKESTSGDGKTGSLELVEKGQTGRTAREGSLTVVETPGIGKLLLVPMVNNLLNVFCNSNFKISNPFVETVCFGVGSGEDISELTSSDGTAPGQVSSDSGEDFRPEGGSSEGVTPSEGKGLS